MKVLLVSTQNWIHTCRLPRAFARAGCQVAACLDDADMLHESTFLAAKFRLSLSGERTARSLLPPIADACLQFQPDLVVACDEGACDLLDALIVSIAASPRPEHRAIPPLLQASKGDPAYYTTLRSKRLASALAAECGLAIPLQREAPTRADAEAFAHAHGYPVVLKAEHGFAGSGVAICNDRAALAAAWEQLGSASGLTVQLCVQGRPAMCAAVAYRGRFIAGFALEALETQPTATGSASVVRTLDHPGMLQATRTFVERTGASGFIDLDFMLDADGQAFFLECNPRPVHATLLGHTVGLDLFAALRAAVEGGVYGGAARPGVTIALFPKELLRDRHSPYLLDAGAAYHEVPWDEPALLRRFMRDYPWEQEPARVEKT